MVHIICLKKASAALCFLPLKRKKKQKQIGFWLGVVVVVTKRQRCSNWTVKTRCGEDVTGIVMIRPLR
ncbi:hypothetical protein ACLOJK_000008 [Asimina triloba]